ncbi:MAG: recombinase family protein [Chloroflexi bacterium]|nr:recombinase family protein [Chloroflexota bacterium]
MATTTLLRAPLQNRDRPLTFEELKGLRAEGYVRDSTLDQRDGFGPEIQRRNIQRFAESYGLALGGRWYTEFVSAFQPTRRHEFEQFLADAQLDVYDVLLVDHISRFGRNQEECIRYKRELQDLGKVVVFVSQGIISGSDRDFLAERINETLDEAYSRNLSRYVRAGKAEQAAQGIALGHAPLGYRHLTAASGRGARPVPDTETMLTLLALLRGYVSGKHSFKTLARSLNAQGYRTKRGNPFTESAVSTVLNNPFDEGKFRYHQGLPDEELREGAHEVPEEVRSLWRRCQEVRRAKAHPGQPSPPSRQHLVYPLTGVLVCDGCGRPFHGVSTETPRGRRLARMFHSWHRYSLTPLSVKAGRVEWEFLDRVLSHLHLDQGWREAVLRALATEGLQPDHSLEITRIEMTLANLRKQHLWGAINDEELRAEFQALERQRRLLEPPPLASLTPNLDRAAELLRDLPALWQHPSVTPEERRDLVRRVFEEVRLRESSLVAVKPRPEYLSLVAYSLWRSSLVGGEGLS